MSDIKAILEKLQEVERKAPRAPWETYTDEYEDYPCVRVRRPERLPLIMPVAKAEQDGVAEFMVAARTALPVLREAAEQIVENASDAKEFADPGSYNSNLGVTVLRIISDALAPLKELLENKP